MKMYSLSKRKKGNEFFFYVQFKDDDTNRYGTAKSVDMLLKKLGDTPHHVTKRPEADSIVRRAIEKGLDGNEKREDPIFVDYLSNFWDFDTSFYVQRENKKRAGSIHRDYVYNMASCIRNHVAPYLPKGLKCSQVKKKHIEKIQIHCVNDCSINVWHSTLRSLSGPIKELQRKGILLIDPLANLDKYTLSNESSVGSLTERETDKLIRQMYYDTEQGYTISVKQRGPNGTYTYNDQTVLLDRRVYLAVCLSASTGMRKGEVLGLMLNDIQFPNKEDGAESQALIIVRHAFAVQQGMKGTKTKRERTVPCPLWLAEELVKQGKTNPYGNGLIFYSDTVSDKPIGPKVLNSWFNKELERIGISEKEREERHLVFHSLRHYANSELLTRVGGEKTRMITGHTSSAMTDRYDTEDKSQRIYSIAKEAGSLISNPSKEREA